MDLMNWKSLRELRLLFINLPSGRFYALVLAACTIVYLLRH